MVDWSPIKLKFTLGIGALCSVAIIGELSQNAIPAWLAVGIAVFPFAVFVFADPGDVRHSVARFLQVGASLWYLAVNSVLVVLFLLGGDLNRGWPILLIGLAVGAVPCLIVLGRAVVPGLTEKPDRENEVVLPLDTTMGTMDLSEPVVYRPRMGKTLLLLLVSSAFVAGGMLMIHEGRPFGWVAVAFFGLGLIVFALQLLPNSSYLRVSSSGIEIGGLWRSHQYKWSDISHFYTGCIGPNKMVLIAFAPSYEQAQTARNVARTLTGAEGALPDTYGFTAEALAAHLNRWKAAHTQADT